MKGETGSRAAPQTEPGWQVPSVRSNAESPVVKPAPGVSGSSAASCPECCSGSSSGALLVSPLSSAGLCKQKVKTQLLPAAIPARGPAPFSYCQGTPIHLHCSPLPSSTVSLTPQGWHAESQSFPHLGKLHAQLSPPHAKAGGTGCQRGERQRAAAPAPALSLLHKQGLTLQSSAPPGQRRQSQR